VAPFPALSDLPKKAALLDTRLLALPAFAVDPFVTESSNPTANDRCCAILRSGYVRTCILPPFTWLRTEPEST
jgi:hypothetical protein